MEGVKILITGGYGMLGRNLQTLFPVKDFHFIIPSKKELNLLNSESISNYLLNSKPDLILHLASKVGGIQDRHKFPFDYLYENTKISVNIIGGAAKAGVKKLINVSTANIFEPVPKNQLCKYPLNEHDGYALAKILALASIETVNKQYGFEYKTLVVCNLFGPYDKFEIQNSQIIPSAIRKLASAKKNGSSVEIWGDGTSIKECLYAEDFSILLVKAIIGYEKLPKLLRVGANKAYTVKELFEITARIIEWNGQFEFDLNKPTSKSHIPFGITDTHFLGWFPETSIEQGIKKTYDYFKKINNYE